MVESGKLTFVRKNQKKLRAHLYKCVKDSVDKGQSNGASIGRRIVLPSTFLGGPRYMVQHYQDSMAICRYLGYPHIFITFTCNPKWPEIERFVTEQGLKYEDRPDIISRVFKMKLNCLMRDLKSGKVFGKVKAVVYTIEFQKRGLPHCHILLFLAGVCLSWSEDQINSMISAEIPDKGCSPKLYDVVQEFMIHGPCGAFNNQSPCMIQNSCNKFYPRDFNDATYVNEDGFPVYRRRDDGKVVEKNNCQLSNQWVVPYNPFLLLKYQSHINVEWCNQTSAVKYLFKYINKGSDRVTAVIGNENEPANEIRTFMDCRYISACEASWRIFGNEIHYRQPAVQRLSMHLPNEQSLIYEDCDDLDDVLNDVKKGKSIFIAWMEANSKYESVASELLYIQFPIFFTYKRDKCEWQPRKTGKSIGRLVHIPYTAGELFYMSLLLNKVKGPKSYEDIRTVNGIVYETFKEAANAYGLLQDDNEFIQAIMEAAIWGSANSLRRLFVTMLLSNSVSMPHQVWEDTWPHLCDDVLYYQRRIMQRPGLILSESEIMNYGLIEVQRILQSNGKSLSDFPSMPVVDDSMMGRGYNRLVEEQLDYDREVLAEEFITLESKLTDEQRDVMNQILDASYLTDGGFFFVYGYGGTGKTFLWNVLISRLRSEGHIVITVASSGIASTLLPGGRTAHSRFAIPIEINDESMCSIDLGSPLAELLIEAKLIIWDEAPMVRKQCFEAFDRTLRDIMRVRNLDYENVVFGGKCVVLGGDFRQILHVIRNGRRSDIVFAAINASYLWRHCRVLTLTRNMRLQSESKDIDLNELREFSEWILKLGDGKLSQPNDGHVQIDISSEFLIEEFSNPINALVEDVYPDFLHNYKDADYLKDRAILAPRVHIVDEVNKYMQSLLPGEQKLYFSSDSLLNEGHHGGSFHQYHSVDFLNSISSSGLPAHELKLKVGVPVMLIRNIDQSAGLCNGTRLIITKLGENVLEGKVLTGSSHGKMIFLPRMNTSLSDSTMPFKFHRRQFPVTISYCMTINKSQGQSVSRVGIYLPKPVFSHGQLYVAVSRVKSKFGLKFLIHDNDFKPLSKTDNVVYLEVYDNIN